MRIYVEANIEGADKIQKQLQHIAGTALTKKVKAAMKECAEIVRDEAKQLAPVGETGRLRDSIIAEVAPGNRVISGYVEADYPKNPRKRKTKTRKQAAGSDEYYAFAVEYGTRHMAAQPFLRPAMQNKAREVGEKLYNSVQEALNDLK